jgi:hypothetical protein
VSEGDYLSADRIATIVETSAVRLRIALAACEYSHRARKDSQSLGSIVQFEVAWFTG